MITVRESLQLNPWNPLRRAFGLTKEQDLKLSHCPKREFEAVAESAKRQAKRIKGSSAQIMWQQTGSSSLAYQSDVSTAKAPGSRCDLQTQKQSGPDSKPSSKLTFLPQASQLDTGDQRAYRNLRFWSGKGRDIRDMFQSGEQRHHVQLIPFEPRNRVSDFHASKLKLVGERAIVNDTTHQKGGDRGGKPVYVSERSVEPAYVAQLARVTYQAGGVYLMTDKPCDMLQALGNIHSQEAGDLATGIIEDNIRIADLHDMFESSNNDYVKALYPYYQCCLNINPAMASDIARFAFCLDRVSTMDESDIYEYASYVDWDRAYFKNRVTSDSLESTHQLDQNTILQSLKTAIEQHNSLDEIRTLHPLSTGLVTNDVMFVTKKDQGRLESMAKLLLYSLENHFIRTPHIEKNGKALMVNHMDYLNKFYYHIKAAGLNPLLKKPSIQPTLEARMEHDIMLETWYSEFKNAPEKAALTMIYMVGYTTSLGVIMPCVAAEFCSPIESLHGASPLPGEHNHDMTGGDASWVV